METAKLMSKTIPPQQIKTHGIIRACFMQEKPSALDYPFKYLGSRNTTSIFKSNAQADFMNNELRNSPPILIRPEEFPEEYQEDYLNLYICGIDLENKDIRAIPEDSDEEELFKYNNGIETFLGYREGDYKLLNDRIISNLPHYNDSHHVNIFYSHGKYIRDNVLKPLESSLSSVAENCKYNFTSEANKTRFEDQLTCERKIEEMLNHGEMDNNQAILLTYLYDKDDLLIGVEINEIFEAYDVDFVDDDESFEDKVYAADVLSTGTYTDLRKKKKLKRPEEGESLSVITDRDDIDNPVIDNPDIILSKKIHKCDYSFKDDILRNTRHPQSHLVSWKELEKKDSAVASLFPAANMASGASETMSSLWGWTSAAIPSTSTVSSMFRGQPEPESVTGYHEI